jgi:hypothetical protein
MPPHKPDRSPKRKGASEFGTFLWQPDEAQGNGSGHGAVHDKAGDKLNLIKYESHTRKFGGYQA